LRNRLLFAVLSSLAAAVAVGQATAADDAGDKPAAGQLRSSLWRFGMIVTASGGPCGAMTGNVTVPGDWPEQQVRTVREERTPGVSIQYKKLEGNVRQMEVKIARLAAGEEARAVVTFEVTRTVQRPPQQTDALVVPNAKKLPAELRQYLSPSPYIEATHPEIVALARQIVEPSKNAWQRVEAIYDWTRQKIEYRKDTPPKSAMQAIKDGFGDCDEMCSVFVALCRAAGIPARMVRIPKHVYAEFYLEDDQARGQWFACQLAGAREFGSISHHEPILQKGDSFKLRVLDPVTKKYKLETYRLVPDTLVGLPVPGGGQPQLRLIAEPAENH